MILDKKKIDTGLIIHIFLCLSLACLIFPFIWMALGAFKTSSEVISIPPTLLPAKFNWDNLSKINELFDLRIFLKNSILVASTTTFIQVTVCIMTGFVFAKINFKGRELLFSIYLITMMVPFQISMIALYKMFVTLGLNDSYLGLILPGVINAFGIFLARQHIKTIPDSFIEAAQMDGASYFRILFRIVTPLCKPVIATLVAFSFMNSWNSFIWPLIIVDSEKLMTLPLGLNKLQGRWTTDWNLLMMGNLFIFIPMFIVYIFAQNFFIKSIAASGVKG